jgi:hypothetical protein
MQWISESLDVFQCRLLPSFERLGRDPGPLRPNTVVSCALIEVEFKTGRADAADLALESCCIDERHLPLTERVAESPDSKVCSDQDYT